MRQGQNGKRSRGRGRRQQNPTNRSYESNGPDVKIRGNANTIVEKYQTLARDAQSSGDRVMAENYLQHAEHYQRILNSFAPPERQERDGDNRGDEQSDQQSDAPQASDQNSKKDEIKVAGGDTPQPDIPDDAHPGANGTGAAAQADQSEDDKPKRRTRRARKPAAEIEPADDAASSDTTSEEPAEAPAG